ncbi:hypothetical protein EO087_01710 [Dyella sp. M7H15-1]|uniref:hypothetical protein n=1 Tax=Dyella sp. M7H15-1 TaxID=2501295 RepID=UPI0010052394|nr:hypothetical protein [Dyella sp. M7H15-1]QAU22859.1 hypothetical protein EO087_01710 [Dyella sp. M7H15-1]
MALPIFHTHHRRMDGCTPPTPAERMARYSGRYAAEIRQRENQSVAPPRARVIDGRLVLIALDDQPTPKANAETHHV